MGQELLLWRAQSLSQVSRADKWNHRVGGPTALQELGGIVSHPALKPGLQEHQLPSPPPSW